DDIFWVGTTAGLLKVNSETHEMQWFLNPKEDEKNFINQNAVRSIYQHHDGMLYYNTWFSKVIRFDPQTELFSDLPIGNEKSEEKSAADKLLSIPIAPIQAKNKDEIWIESLVGLMTYDIPSQKWTRIQWNSIEKNKYFGARFIDSKNRAWMHPNEGLRVFDRAQQQFIEYDYGSLNQGNYGFSFYFLESNSAEVFAVLARSADGIYEFDIQTKNWKKFKIPSQYLDLNNRFVPYGYSKGPSGNWTIIDPNNIFDYNPQKKAFRRLAIPFEFSKITFKSVLWDKKGNLWLGTLSSGLLKWNTKTNQWTRFKRAFEPKVPVDNVGSIDNLFEDSQGNIWINRSGGYSIFDAKRDTFYNFLDRQNPPVEILVVKDFQEDSTGRIWVNGVNGVLAYGKAKEPEKGLQMKLDLMKTHQINTIISMDLDDQNNLWMLGRDRLAKLQIDNMEVSSHSLNYGIDEDAFYSFKLLSNEKILIGGENKIWIANIEDLHPNTENPIPYITDIQVLQTPYQSEEPIHLVDELNLSYAQNFFSFEFSSIGFTKGDENQFRYRLQNFDNQWTAANKRRFANFTNVPPGTYTFQLQVANNEGVWNNNILEIPLSIATPWWQRLWFYILSAFVLGGIAYFSYRLRIKQVRKEERLRIEYEKKLTNVEMAALRAQMNPHFIFNSLNSIEFFIITNEPETAVDYLNRFSRLVRLILQNSQNTVVPLKDDLEALQLYIEMENMRFDNFFDYDLRVEENIDHEKVEIPPLLLQPYVENAIWHGLMQKKSGRGRIDISIRKDSKSLICILEDNGIGRDAAKKLKSKSATKGKSYGMKITKDRLEAISLLEDAKASVEVFDLKDNFGIPKGTRIELIIPISS
ncbi:MAG: histidine kinase, partial [Bacteroidota bacterium]